VRFVAFTLLASAAFDGAVPWLDRVGTAALGLAFLALALAPGGFPRSRPARMTFPPKTVLLPDTQLDGDEGLAARLAPYSASLADD